MEVERLPPSPGIDVPLAWPFVPPVISETGRPATSSKLTITIMATTNTPAAAMAMRFHGSPANVARHGVVGGVWASAFSACLSSALACSISCSARLLPDCTSECAPVTLTRARLTRARAAA